MGRPCGGRRRGRLFLGVNESQERGLAVIGTGVFDEMRLQSRVEAGERINHDAVTEARERPNVGRGRRKPLFARDLAPWSWRDGSNGDKIRSGDKFSAPGIAAAHTPDPNTVRSKAPASSSPWVGRYDRSLAESMKKPWVQSPRLSQVIDKVPCPCMALGTVPGFFTHPGVRGSDSLVVRVCEFRKDHASGGGQPRARALTGTALCGA